MSSTRSRFQHVFGTVIVLGIIGAVSASATLATTPPVPAVAVSQQEVVNPNPYNSEPIETYTAAVREFQATAEQGHAKVEETDQKTLSDENRDALQTASDELAALVKPADDWLVGRVDALVEIHQKNQFPPLFLSYDVDEAERLTGTIESLLPKVDADVEAWEAEQVRQAEIARQQAAAQAEVARVQATSPARSAQAGTPVQSSGVAYSFSSIGAANQSAIDSCSGFGDTTGWLGVSSFSVHWHCGGSTIASLSPGQTIRVNNGQYAGLWRAEGLAYRLNGNVNTTADIRRTGGLQIQTCLGGTYSNLGYFLFTKVG